MTLTSQQTDPGAVHRWVGNHSAWLFSYVNPLLCVYTLPSRQADDQENRLSLCQASQGHSEQISLLCFSLLVWLRNP